MPRRPLPTALLGLLVPGLLLAGTAAPAAAAAAPVALESGSTPTTRPFPDDAFTVADAAQTTGRRVNLPTAGCAPVVCATLAQINRLDGFDVRPRVTLPFTAAVDLRTVTPSTVRIEGPGGFSTGLVQLVQDPTDGTVAGFPDQYLAPATTYTLVIGSGLKAADGSAVTVSPTGAARRTTFTTMTSTDVLDDARAALDSGAAYTAASIGASERTLRFDTAADGQPSIFPGSTTGTTISRSEQVKSDTATAGAFQTRPVTNTAKTFGFYGFGSITSPQYLRPDVTIATPASGSSVTPVGKARLGVAMVAPTPSAACIKPVVFGHGFTRTNLDLFVVADTLGTSNLAVFATDVPGHGFGPASAYTVTAGGTSRTGALLGRGTDLDRDGAISSFEGSVAGAAAAAIGSRDALVQAVVDNMALVRALERGVDVDGNGTLDTCTGEGSVTYYGQSFGGTYGTILLGTDPHVRAGVANVGGAGPVTEIIRLGAFRPLLGANLGAAGLLNGPPGLSGFTESMPLRRDPKVSDPRQGAIPIQETLAESTWVQRSGSPEAYAPRLRPGATFGDKRVLMQVAYGDGTVPNPTAAEVLRAGDLYDNTWVFRSDRTAAAATDPHGFLLDPFLPAHFEGQEQIRRFLGENEERDPDTADKPNWEPALAKLGSTPSTDYRVQLDCLHYPDPQTGSGQTRTSPAADCTDRSAEVTAASAPTATRFVALPTAQRVVDTRTGLGTSQGPKTGRFTVDLGSAVPDVGATTAVLNVTVLNATRRGFVVVFPSGARQPGTSNVNVEAAVPGKLANTQANEVFVRLSQRRQVDVVVDSTTAQVVVDVVGYLTPNANPAAGRLKTVPVSRLLDSRTTAERSRSGEVVVDLTGTPAATATAVILNVTATETTGRGFITAYPTGTTKPETSNVNYERGQTQANEVLVRVGQGSKVTLDVATAAAVVVDLVGAVDAPGTSGGSDYASLATPQRLLDTRNGTGVKAGRKRGTVDLVLPSTLPAGVTGVVLNVTAVGADRPGFVTVFPGGTAVPATSNVNFSTGLAQANEVLTAVGAGRTVSLFVGGARDPQTHLVADVVGYLTAPAG